MKKNETVTLGSGVTMVNSAEEFNLAMGFLGTGSWEFCYVAAGKSAAGRPRLIARVRPVNGGDDDWFDTLVPVQQTLDFTHTNKTELFEQIADATRSKTYKGKLVKDMDENGEQRFIKVKRSDNGEDVKVMLTKWVKYSEE